MNVEKASPERLECCPVGARFLYDIDLTGSSAVDLDKLSTLELRLLDAHGSEGVLQFVHLIRSHG